MRKIQNVRAVLVATFALALTGTGLTAAYAAASDCPSSYLCVWLGDSYSIGMDKSTGSMIMGLVYNDQISSVASHGNTNCAKFWEHGDFSGKSIYFSRPGRGGIYQDPYLTNGGGYGPYSAEDWDNKISSANWRTCPF